MKTCHIIGAGEMTRKPEPGSKDLVIAVDAGFLHTQALGLRVDVVLGDFDSLNEVPDHPCVIRLNPIKDETDMLAAIGYAIDEGCKVFHLYGGTGGRLSHTLANIQCLNRLAERGLRGYLYGDGETLTALTHGSIHFEADSRGYVSAFALSGVCEGVCERGLKYLLDEYTMCPDNPIGVSNEFIGCEAEIAVRQGTLLIVYGVEAHEKRLAAKEHAPG